MRAKAAGRPEAPDLRRLTQDKLAIGRERFQPVDPLHQLHIAGRERAQCCRHQALETRRVERQHGGIVAIRNGIDIEWQRVALVAAQTSFRHPAGNTPGYQDRAGSARWRRSPVRAAGRLRDWCCMGISGIEIPAIRAIRGDQMPAATTRISVRMRPRVVSTACTCPFDFYTCHPCMRIEARAAFLRRVCQRLRQDSACGAIRRQI